MGQAKIRSEEINALKSKNANAGECDGDQVKLIAVKNLKNGGKHIAIINDTVNNFSKSKDQLLKEICTQEWGGESMFKKIANYFSLTSNYQIYKMMGMYGFVVNFYESDDDYGGAYSCRKIVAFRDDVSFDRVMKQLINVN